MAAHWITGDIAADVNSNRLSCAELPLLSNWLAEMVNLNDGGMISDPAASIAIVEELFAAHPAAVDAFRCGKSHLKLAHQILGQKLKG